MENSSTEIKLCPFCNAEISFDAKKCKFCGEWVDENKKIFLKKSENLTGVHFYSTGFGVLCTKNILHC